MYNLIVTVLSIIIMIAAAIAGLSYLGPAFSTAASKAVAVELVNAGSQFAGAEALYKADNGGDYDIDGATAGSAAADLITGGYLSGAPAIPKIATGPWTIAAGVTGVNGGNPVVTLALKTGNNAGVATCTELANEATGVYGCDSIVTPTLFHFNL